MKIPQIPKKFHGMASQIAMAAMLLAMANSAHAAGFSLPGFSEIGCTIISWLTGELSVMIFFVVVIVTLLIGFFAKMDWTKILSIIVLFGLIKGVTTLFSGYLTNAASCIASAVGA